VQSDLNKKRTTKVAKKECVTPNESCKKQRLESELTMSSMNSLMQCPEHYQLQNIPKLDFDLSSNESSKEEQNSEALECVSSIEQFRSEPESKEMLVCLPLMSWIEGTDADIIL
jgi:hypothetical protein